MIFTPTGTAYLIENVFMDARQEDNIDFANAEEQAYYFQSRSTRTIEECTYIRKDKAIKVSYSADELFGTNYIMYKNEELDRWIYCFIISKEYIASKTTILTIKTDVFQTYMFDYWWNDTFVAREHQNRWHAPADPIFNLNDEGLTLGDEYLKIHDTSIAESEGYYLVVASQQLEDIGNYSPPNMVQGCPTPLYFYVVFGVEDICVLLSDDASIISMSLIPFLTYDASVLTPVNYVNTHTQEVIPIKRIMSNQPTRKVLGNITKYEATPLPSVMGIGIPKDFMYESKLLTYPYTYHVLTDYQSSPMVLKNEYLESDLIEVSVVQTISHDSKTKFYISTGYKGEYNGKENCLFNTNVNDLPLITDAYKNYIQQHKASATAGMALAGANLAIGTIGAIATGGVSLIGTGNAMLSAVSSIGGELAKQKDLQNTPDTVRERGNNIAFEIADGNLSIRVVTLSIHANIKKVLGDYFAKYGYKCHEVKVPQLNSRYYYNYIKTIGCNIDGNFDNEDLIELKDIFDKGITIWHNNDGVTPLSYSFDNVESNLI